MDKVMLFSHTDLDGYGCNIVLEALNIPYFAININYENNNEVIKEYIEGEYYKDYKKTYITDMSVNEEVAELINNTKDLNLVLLDHHPTSEWLNKYNWAKVLVDGAFEKTSGTEMLFNYLLSTDCNILFNNKENLYNIISLVQRIKRYDTWLWKDKYNDESAKKLSDLFYILGGINFITRLNEYKYNADLLINEYEYLLKAQQEKINKYMEKKNKELIKKRIDEYEVGIVFANQFQSELGNKLAELNPDCDLIAMIGENTISYRSIKDNVNCGEFAKLFGGGGHPKTAGSEISLTQKEDIINILFKGR